MPKRKVFKKLVNKELEELNKSREKARKRKLSDSSNKEKTKRRKIEWFRDIKAILRSAGNILVAPVSSDKKVNKRKQKLKDIPVIVNPVVDSNVAIDSDTLSCKVQYQASDSIGSVIQIENQPVNADCDPFSRDGSVSSDVFLSPSTASGLNWLKSIENDCLMDCSVDNDISCHSKSKDDNNDLPNVRIENRKKDTTYSTSYISDKLSFDKAKDSMNIVEIKSFENLNIDASQPENCNQSCDVQQLNDTAITAQPFDFSTFSSNSYNIRSDSIQCSLHPNLNCNCYRNDQQGNGEVSSGVTSENCSLVNNGIKNDGLFYFGNNAMSRNENTVKSNVIFTFGSNVRSNGDNVNEYSDRIIEDGTTGSNLNTNLPDASKDQKWHNFWSKINANASPVNVNSQNRNQQQVFSFRNSHTSIPVDQLSKGDCPNHLSNPNCSKNIPAYYDDKRGAFLNPSLLNDNKTKGPNRSARTPWISFKDFVARMSQQKTDNANSRSCQNEEDNNPNKDEDTVTK